MKIYLGADYKGFEKKNFIKKYLEENGLEVFDLGAHEYTEGDDFNDPAKAVSQRVQNEPDAYGILICDSAHGMTMQANRFKKVRAAHCNNPESARLAREHDGANVLCMSAHFMDESAMVQTLNTFITTEFMPLERRMRRINKLDEEIYD